jgi:hypothetical protein
VCHVFEIRSYKSEYMPYNVIPSCPIGTETKITFQFSGQNPSIRYVDDYLITTENISPDKVEHYVTVSYLPTRNDGLGGYSRMTYTIKDFSPFLGGVVERLDEYSLGHPVVQVVQMKTIEQDGRYGWNTFAFNKFPWLPSLAMPGSVTVTIGDPTGVILPGWYRSKIAFFKNGLGAGSVTEQNKTVTASWECIPVVTCPADTCAVDCGTYVCCYNAQGISVFNFNK